MPIAIAETPKKKADGENRFEALRPAVTQTAESSYAHNNDTARRSRKETAPAMNNYLVIKDPAQDDTKIKTTGSITGTQVI